MSASTISTSVPDKAFSSKKGVTDGRRQHFHEVINGVVRLDFSYPIPFDGEAAFESAASGSFVLANQETQLGYILTAGHVSSFGPFCGTASFANYDKFPVSVVYRDPVHDFSFLSFDLRLLKDSSIQPLELRPDLAQVGCEIHVIGNDAGETLSILSGVISRTDRNAPDYSHGYNDYNTPYFQASAAACGGSSGSPVVDANGYVVALQVGGRRDKATTTYFLPLELPLKVLGDIEAKRTVNRGTLQVIWELKPIQECRRLGLSSGLEEEIRGHFTDPKMMLVAKRILPASPADRQILEGDILFKINGRLVTDFTRYGETLDASVTKEVHLNVQRRGKETEIKVRVDDLKELTPDRFVTVSRGSFHNLSHQMACRYNIPVAGVYIADGTRFLGISADLGDKIVVSVNQQEISDLEEFLNVVKHIGDEAMVPIRYKYLMDPKTIHTAIVPFDGHWTDKIQMAIRNDATGVWDFTDVADLLKAAPVERTSARFPPLESSSNRPHATIFRSFVRIQYRMVEELDGVFGHTKKGWGIVLNEREGLVFVSRSIVPHDLADIWVTIAGSIVVKGRIRFIHELSYFVIVQYDPNSVDAPVGQAPLSSEYPQHGQVVTFVGFSSEDQPVYASTKITDIESAGVLSDNDGSAVTMANMAGRPVCQILNQEVLSIDTTLGETCTNGVLINQNDVVCAIWMASRAPFHDHRQIVRHVGLPTPEIREILKQMSNGEDPHLNILSMQLRAIRPFSDAKAMGVPEEWIGKIAAASTPGHQLFEISRTDCTTAHEAESLLVGDIILTINSQLITSLRDLAVIYNSECVDVHVVRQAKETTIRVSTTPMRDMRPKFALKFCGALLQEPSPAVLLKTLRYQSHVYVSFLHWASPARKHGLATESFIKAVNGRTVFTYQDFKKEVLRIPVDSDFDLRLADLNGVESVIVVKNDERYFPTVEYLRKAAGQWRRVGWYSG